MDSTPGRRGIRAPRHCLVVFGSFTYPGILLEWRPLRHRGGLSKWEGLVIYASQQLPSEEWSVKQGWLHGDLLRPAVGLTGSTQGLPGSGRVG